MSVAVPRPTVQAAHAELRLPPSITAPAAARRTVHDLLGALPPSLQAQVSLVVSELVTNVLRHCAAEEPVTTLTIALAPDRVTVAVADPGRGFDPPDPRDPRDPREPGNPGEPVGGWGLQVLDAVADRWWVERDGGCRVICEIYR